MEGSSETGSPFLAPRVPEPVRTQYEITTMKCPHGNGSSRVWDPLPLQTARGT
jgi:hypothetical protein